MTTLAAQPRSALPYSEDAERSVVGQMLANPACIGEVTATLLQGAHFHIAAHKLIFDEIVERFYGSDPTDPLTVAEALGAKLSRIWSCDEREVVAQVQHIASSVGLSDPVAHAKVVKDHADLRSLLHLANTIQAEVDAENLTPDQIAAVASSEAMKIATNAVTSHEIVTLGDAGRHFVKVMKERVAYKQAGINPGVKFGINAIDAFTKGLLPTELLIAGGESGVGKTGFWWVAGMKYAEAQSKRSADERMGTLLLSLEMGDVPGETRLAQQMTQIDSGHMREGTLTQAEMTKIVKEWGARKDFPLYLNFASGLTLSQLRAVVSEGIRKFNVGLVIIDHFLLLYPDTRMEGNEADDERVRFLKNQIAKDLNVAVICLAHTRKAIERADKRPRMSDLRGSGMIAAFADFVPLMFRPWPYLSEKERDAGRIQPTDVELLHVKNRHGIEGTGEAYFDAARQLAI